MTDYIIIEVTKTVEPSSLGQVIREALVLNEQKDIHIEGTMLYVEASNVPENITIVNNCIDAHDYAQEMANLEERTHEFASSCNELQITVETLKNIGILTGTEYNNFVIKYKELHTAQAN